MEFYKKTNGSWRIGQYTLSKNSCSQHTDLETGEITIQIIGGHRICAKKLPTEFTDALGVNYADLVAYELATSDFFLKASSEEATQTLAGLLSASDKTKLDGLSAPLKNNLSAIATPVSTDDSSKGYSTGSIWVYAGITYTCTQNTVNASIWASSADIFYFDDWASLVAAISATGNTYLNKYATVTNANVGSGSGTTYTAPAAIPSQIVDGGTATYKVLAQGANYSVNCLKRQIVNPAITSVQSTAVPKPTVAGYYIFTVTPSNGMPAAGVLGDILFYDGATWSRFQSYSSAPMAVIVGATTASQILWGKQGGTWVNPDNLTIPWATGVSYRKGIRITYGSTILMCYVPHTSSASFWTDFQTGKWWIDGGENLLITQAQRLAITVFYNGLTVHQTDGVIGEWEYTNGAWKTPAYINDQVASGYYDVGNIRTQWGITGSGGDGNGGVSITFPAPFANTSYAFTGSINGGSSTALYLMFLGGRTTTTVWVYKKWQNMATSGAEGTQGVTWIAIGLKP